MVVEFFSDGCSPIFSARSIFLSGLNEVLHPTPGNRGTTHNNITNLIAVGFAIDIAQAYTFNIPNRRGAVGEIVRIFIDQFSHIMYEKKYSSPIYLESCPSVAGNPESRLRRETFEP